MATFPTNLTSLTTSYADNVDDILATNQNTPNAEINAIAAKVGKDSSLVTTSHDYKLGNITGTQKAASEAYVDENCGSAINNLLKNGNFINNSSNGYGTTPDDWVNSNANPVQGGFPSMTKAQLIALLGISDGDIEGLWNLNEASGDAVDLSSNGYNLTDTNSVLSSDDGLMGKARDFEYSNSEYFTGTTPNIAISGDMTVFGFFKAESFTGNSALFRLSGATTGRVDAVYAGGTIYIRQNQSTALTNYICNIQLETGKWYFFCFVFNETGSVLNAWFNGIKKVFTLTNRDAFTGTMTTMIGTELSNYWDGLMQDFGVLSVALTDSQVKKLFAATMYRGQKIRRATTDAYLYQSLPEDLVERLRGKDVSIVAKAYQEVASTAQVSIDDGTDTESTASATTGSWLNIGVSKTISATATAITLKLKHSTSDGNSWFKEVAFYEGSSLVYVWYPSYDDISRFPRLLKMDIPAVINGYSFEEGRWFTWAPVWTASGSLTFTSVTSSIARYLIRGKSAQWKLKVSGTLGGSASTSLLYTLPVVGKNNSVYEQLGFAYCNDAGNVGGFTDFNNASTIQARVEKIADANWSTSGAGGAYLNASCEID